MNNDVDNKIARFKKIQSKLSNIVDKIKGEDRNSINAVWKDKNSELFLDTLDTICLDIENIIFSIDDSIKEISTISNNGGNL